MGLYMQSTEHACCFGFVSKVSCSFCSLSLKGPNGVQETESKASTQVQGLQAELLRMQREVEAFKAGAQKHDAELASLSSSCGAATSEAARAKERTATLEEALAKSEAQVRRLQGYIKQLEAAQRVKDAQVRDARSEQFWYCMR